jgi:hypothetical protein
MSADAECDTVLDDYQRRMVVRVSGATLTCSHTVLLYLGKPTVLITLPFGVPATVARAAFGTFESEFNVVTWESRYILDLSQMFSGMEKLELAEHVTDIVRTVCNLQIGYCCLVGYCANAENSLFAAEKYSEIFAKPILANGEYRLFRKGRTVTGYQRSIDTLLEVARGRKLANSIFSKMAELPVGKSRCSLNWTGSTRRSARRNNYVAMRRTDVSKLRFPQYRCSGPPGQIRSDWVAGRASSTKNSETVDAGLPRSAKFVNDQNDHYEFCRHRRFFGARAGTVSIEVVRYV